MFCYCAQSRRLVRLLTTRYDAALESVGLTAAQFEVLSVAQGLRESTGREFAEYLAVDKTTLSRNLKPLLAAKLIVSRRGESDGRQTLYRLTPKGVSRLQKAMPLWQAAHEDTVRSLGSYAVPAERGLQRMTAAFL